VHVTVYIHNLLLIVIQLRGVAVILLLQLGKSVMLSFNVINRKEVISRATESSKYAWGLQ